MRTDERAALICSAYGGTPPTIDDDEYDPVGDLEDAFATLIDEAPTPQVAASLTASRNIARAAIGRATLHTHPRKDPTP